MKIQNNELLNEVKTLQIKSDLLIAELRLSAAKQEELLKKVNDLQSQLSSLLTQIATLNKQLENQNADVQLIKNKLSQLETQYQGIFKQLEELQKLSQILAEIEKMKTQITQLDTRYNTILSGLAQNKQQLDALKTQITDVQTQIVSNLSKINQLISQLGDQGVVIGTILKQIELLKISNAELIKLIETLLIGKSPVPTNGLVGWWPFNGNANDESGNNLNGVVIGANLTNNRLNQVNKAYNFNSTTVSNIKFDLKSKFPSDISNEYTFMIWVKPNRTVSVVSESNLCNGSVYVPMANSNQNWAFIPPTGTNSTLGVGLSVGTNGIFVANHAANLLVSRASFPSQMNDFQFVVVSQKSNVTKVYINGKLEKTVSNYCVSSTKFLGNEVELGGDLYSPNFSGIIDDFAIWNRELSADEITKIFAGQGF
jgi:archaellum component FlaC